MNGLSRRRLLRTVLALAALGLVSGCGLVSPPGQQAAVPRRIGLLESGATLNLFEPFREGLRDLGYVEGRDILIEHRSAEGNLDRLPTLAADLVGLPVEIIVVTENAAQIAASRATSTIPIVAGGANVVSAGLVTSIARPEGNITGVTSNATETVGKRVELIKDTVPTISRLAVVWGRGSTTVQANMQLVERAAEVLQLHATWYEVTDLDDLPAVFATARADGADGLVVQSGGILGGNTDPRIGGAVLKSRLPAVAEQRAFAASGGLLAHGTRPGASARRAASYVDKILKGARPGDLPIELPTEFHIVVNLRTAQELGIAIPQSVLNRATEVIQ